jgi:DNA-binding NarL/FixJ family response regulator
MIRVVIADDHHLVRQGICKLIESVDDIEVIGEAASGREAVDLVKELQPEVVIMDIGMPRLDGGQATEQIVSLDLPTQVVILSMHSDPVLAQQLLREGAKGYLLKDSLAEELPLAIRAAFQGKMYLSPAISDSVLTKLMNPRSEEVPDDLGDLLTPREREVLQLVAEGYTNRAVAEELTISVKTVEKHRANVMSKLEASDLPTLIRTAMKHGLIFPDT